MRIFILIVLTAISLNSFSQKKIKTDKLFIYYMPYDNNLSKYGDSIINMLKSGSVSEKIVVAVCADFDDTLGIRNYIITKDSVRIFNLKNESSANAKTFDRFLNNIYDKVDFKKYYLIFLNHGGKLDEICLDEYPEYKFLKLDSVNRIIQNFNKKVNKKAELIFFQVCVKASIEALYQFRSSSKFSLSSQAELVAPDNYYEGLLKHASENIDFSGSDMAKYIAKNSTNNMFYTYTCIDNSKLNKLSLSFNRYLASAKNSSLEISKIKTIEYYGETYWDLESFIMNIELNKKHKIAKRNKLLNDIKDAVYFRTYNPIFDDLKEYSGLSVYGLSNKNYDNKYQNLYFFKDVKIKKFKKSFNPKNL